MTALLNAESPEYQGTKKEKLRERWANEVLKHYLMKGYFSNQSNVEPEKR